MKSMPLVRPLAGVVSRAAALVVAAAGLAAAQPYLDNETQYSNQDPNTETRRSDHFRICFGHYNRDTGTPVTEQLVQGNLQMFEQAWHRWVVEMGLNDVNESATKPDGNKYRANFNMLMTWDDGGGGGAYMSMDSNGFAYAMANSGYCRFDPPSGATPHEFGHVWQGRSAGFNGSNSSGAWWECHANWMQLQFTNSYPHAGGYIYNGIYYPAHGRNYYDAFMIWEAARDDSRYGAQWVNSVWTDATPEQRTNEFIIDRMIRLDSSGSPDKPGAMNDLWGNMARKMVTWDYERKQWLAQANKADDGSDWEFYQRCRTPLVKVPGTTGANWYRPSRGHLPMQFGFNFIPLQAAAGTTVSCDFAPHSDPVRQSDWRACLVAVDTAGGASYSSLWNTGTNSITLSADQTQLYLVVIATPKPMKIPEPMWQAYLSNAGLQFPYAVSFTNAAPRNVIYPVQSRSGMVQHANGGGWKSTTATVDATAYIGPHAQVLNSAQVRGNARVEDYAVVRNNARVRDSAVVSGHAEVKDNAQVYGNAKVRDWGRVFGYAEVYENARVIEHGNCGDGNATTHTKVYGNAIVKGTTYVYNTTTINGSLIMDGDSANGNGTAPASKGVHFGWSWGADAARFNGLADNGYLFARHSFERDNAVFAMDEFGINHGFLLNGCRTGKDTGTSVRGGRVLPLNGTNQAVELHNGVNDLKDGAFSLWFKLSGGPAEQRLWSMGDGASKVMYLTPNAADSGALRLVITDGTTTHALDGPVIPAGVWKHVSVVFAGTTCTLYVDGLAVASNPGITLVPDSLNAPLMENANFLGRGNTGGYFQGALDDFRCSMRSLSAAEALALFNEAAPAPVTLAADTTAPTPNAATWLVAPISNGDSSATMSATPGTDASGWVEYYFTCVSGGGHDSGWVSFNKYTDVGLPPGSAPTYTVKMRDRNGNITAESAPASVTLATSSAGDASFSYGPVGIANGQITMTATQGANASGKVEYKFDRTLPTAVSSGWRSSPTWTQSGLTTGTSYTYTVTVRDGRGNTSAPSAPATAIARDDAAPGLPIPVAHWQMLPYATIDNKVSMTAQAASDPSGVEYQFQCVSGGGPHSAWQSSRTFVTSVLAEGTYVYQYKVRDRSARNNESPVSTSYPATITRTSGYHTYTLEQVLAGTDDWLVSFPATVMKVNADHYMVKNLATGNTIKVKPNTYALITDPSLALRNVTVKGHLYTLGGSRVVTYSTLTSTGSPPLYAIAGKVTNASGVGIAGATVCFSDVANASASPIVTATTDASGNFSKGVTTGTWYVVVTSGAYNTSTDQTVIVTTSTVSGVNFTLESNASVTGTIVRASDGTPLAGASVYFSRSPGASAAAVFTATADTNGNFLQEVQDGVWYVAAGAAGHYTSADKQITVHGSAVGGIGFALKNNARSIPQTSDLLFSVVTDSLPVSGATGNWATYLPSGQNLTAISSPTVELANGVKWASHFYADGDGFRQGHYTAPIPINGATIVVAARPERNTIGTSWTSIVDIFYQRLVLGIRNDTGQIVVWRNNNLQTGPAIPDGQATVLSLVVQPTGQYKVFANGVQVMNITSTSDMTSLNPDMSANGAGWGSDAAYTHYINVGRNDPDGWTTFNGGIGDVFVYKTALADAARQQLEADMTAKFISTDHTITATAGAGGIINPSGAVPVVPGGGQTLTITPLAGYLISGVTVDGVPQGAVGSYAFSNVAANHTISASFTAGTNTPPTISTIATQEIPANTQTGALAFTVADAESPADTLTLAGSSNNTALVPASNIEFGGSGANRTVTVTPTPAMSGSATITLTVSDGEATASVTFTLTVTPVVSAATVSINVGANGAIGAADMAGAVSSAHWNNLTGTGNPVAAAGSLVNNAGASVAGMAVSFQGSQNTFNAGFNPNTNLLSGFLSGTPMSATLTGIPYAKYDVYVYYNGFFSNHSLTWRLSDVTGSPVVLDTRYAVRGSVSSGNLFTDNGNSHVLSQYDTLAAADTAAAAGTGGTYLKFSGVTAPAIKIEEISNNGGNENGFTGIQIVNASADGGQTITFRAGDGKLTDSQYADSWINQSSPTANHGTATTLTLRTGTTDQNIGLVAFFGIFGNEANRIPVGSVIQSATLRMVNANDRGKQNDIHVIDRAWTEAAVTWNNFFAGDAGYGPYLTTIGTSSGVTGTHTIDIKSAVQAWANDPATHFGLLFRSNGVGSYNDPQKWTSGENATTADRPLLTVTFVPPNQAPVITAAAAATPVTVTETSCTLTVTASDDAGEAGLTYTWSASGGTAGRPVSFSANDTNAAQTTTATFGGAGTYPLLVTVTDGVGLTATSEVIVTVVQTPATVTVSPASLSVAIGDTGRFDASVVDQFGDPVESPTVGWSVNGGGTIDGSGLFTATTAGGPFTVAASGGAASGTATVTVIQPEGYARWQTESFTPEQIAAGEAAEIADPDHDGLANLAEYALGTDPHAFTPPPGAVEVGEGLILTFRRPRGLPDVTYTAESSDDLIHWTPRALELIEDGPVQTMRAVDPLTTGDPARRMIRLRFTK